jgi:hypothetical protein
MVERGFDPANRNRFWKLLSIVGRIDRIMLGYAPDRQRPPRSRIFIRVTGSINHRKLAEAFRQDWPAVIIQEEKGPQGEPITLVSSSLPIAPAFALVGNTDLILAGFEKTEEKHHLDVVRQMLDLRAGHRAALPWAFARELQEIPDETWVLMMGQPPDAFKNLPPFRVLPRHLAFTLSGSPKVAGRFQADLPTAADARAFAANLTQLKEMGTAFVKNPPIRLNPQATEVMLATLNSLQVEVHEERVQGVLHVSSEAFNAVAEILRDLPFSLLQQLTGPQPTP